MKEQKTISCWDVNKSSQYFKIVEGYAKAYNSENSSALKNNLIIKVLKEDSRHDFEPSSYLVIERVVDERDEYSPNDYSVYGEYSTLEKAIEKQVKCIENIETVRLSNLCRNLI